MDVSTDDDDMIRYTTKHSMMRIYRVVEPSLESKQWCAEHRGEYPPALADTLAQKTDFSQLEDFNKKGEGEESAYTKLIKERQRKGEAEGV